MQFTTEQARKYAGFTQEQMGKAIRVHRSTYMKIEKGPAVATIHQINMISDVTGIPIGDFIGYGNHRLCRWRYPVKKL